MAVDKEFEGDQLLILNGGYNRILNHYTETIGLQESHSSQYSSYPHSKE